jgi:hypothetical protein
LLNGNLPSFVPDAGAVKCGSMDYHPAAMKTKNLHKYSEPPSLKQFKNRTRDKALRKNVRINI